MQVFDCYFIEEIPAITFKTEALTGTDGKWRYETDDIKIYFDLAYPELCASSPNE